MTGSILSSHDELVCHARFHHVEPYHGRLHWANEHEARDENERGYCIESDELLLFGRDPRLEHVNSPETRTQLESLLNDSRRLRLRRLAAPSPPDTHVSSVQVAVWFEGNRLMVASVGTNRVDIQRWGAPCFPLSAWPGEAAGQLATLWLPLTQGEGGQNLRWRVALAYTGPDDLIADGLERTDAASSLRTGHPGSVSLTAKRRNVVVELFKDWLGFPACTYDPRPQTIAHSRTDEQEGSEDRATRFERLEPVLDQLRESGYVGKIRDPAFLRALVERQAIEPHDLCAYPDLVSIDLLLDLRLIRAGGLSR